MLDKQIISYLKLMHGSFNLLMMFLFLYQGLMGFKIRKQRRSSGPPLFQAIKRHRKNGPAMALMGVAGFFAGIVIIYLDAGTLFKYPFHFIAGLMIAALITFTYFVSGRIKGTESRWRDLHFRIGILILILYPVQAFLGAGILFK